MLNKLNPEQRAAAAHIDGPLLILAGAGSGKTRTIVYRIAHFLEEGISPDNILAVSFTNKAVREMEERVAELITQPQKTSKLTLKTFHSLGVMILRNNIQQLDYPSKFTIFDPGDQISMVRKVMREIGVDEKMIEPKEILAAISNAKNRLEDPQDVEFPLVRDIYDGYQKNLQACGAVDFDDLIFLPVKLLQDFEHIRDYWGRKFKYIMIDEYQDTNYAQFVLVQELASVYNNLCVVGDDDQSIYGWRGSDVENIRQFHRQFENTKIVKLTQNYRCSGNILEAANKVINQGKGRFEKELWTEAEPGPKVALVHLDDEVDEAKFVVSNMQDVQYSENLKWSDVAILYRTNLQARQFEEYLRLERIPYQIIGGQKFYERKEIRDILAYLRVIHQPEDEIALRRIINYPSRGIGLTTIGKLSDYAKENKLSFYKTCTHAEVLELSKPAKKSLVNFLSILEKYQRSAKNELLSSWLPELLQEIQLQQSIYKEYPKLSEAAKRLENIDVFEQSIRQYEARSKDPNLAEFLERVCLDNNNEEDPEKEGNNAVTMMTLHSAKGLEFPVVYLVGMEEGFMPFFRNAEDTCNVEEERRLCYVGITRAKIRLYLTKVLFRNKYGQKVEREPSRFLDDIPPSLLRSIGKDEKEIFSNTEEEKDQKFANFFASIQAMQKPKEE